MGSGTLDLDGKLFRTFRGSVFRALRVLNGGSGGT
jgi:hypothetical protein